MEGMSAYLDKDQVVKFYFGNAMRDLAAMLPKEDASSLPTAAHGGASLSSLDHSLSAVEETLDQVLGAQRELSFLVHDIGRLLKKIG